MRAIASGLAAVALSAATAGAATQPAFASTKAVTTIKPGQSAKVLLDGKKRKVEARCVTTPGYPDVRWCERWGVTVAGKVKLRLPKSRIEDDYGRYDYPTLRAVKVAKKLGLLAVDLHKTENLTPSTINTDNTKLAKIYRYKKLKLVVVRDLLADHRKLHGARLDSGYTRSHIEKISALKGGKIKVIWETVDWSCSNDHPSITYKYAGGRLKVVGHTTVGRCA